MPTLLECQQAMGRWLLADDGEAGEALSEALPAYSRERLEIYRNGTRCTLLNALRVAFPALRRVVGDEFFEAAARQFIVCHPPNSAYLNPYGRELGAFLSTFAPGVGVPYLAALAELEWAINRALHAEDAAGLSAARWACLQAAVQDEHTAAQLRLIPHPSVCTLRLRYPADVIWRAVLEQDEAAMAGIDLAGGPVHLLIERDTHELVQVSRCDAAVWRLTERLCAGVPVQEALLQVLPAAGSGDAGSLALTAVLAEHLSRGRFIDFSVGRRSV